ncbi:hypothetical protein [Aurantiacibacter rhizosphaerae]|uniref:Uncharacterized protein n=1 Tax=Aurantiacibacter rhizosphaerae TaxID=2691582 RepID=A0A844X9I7_9SPHN|nr:hypothetical protein [Aurantiacibacter rhizosphaerae]MWV26422.1 hypothetical protein [Aurantiacibacter rhizosphaerae]
MKVEGPRPWPIRLFAILFLGAALLRLVAGLYDPTRMIADLLNWLPRTAITTDLAIVALSAEFTIACIPVALVWFRAVRIARIVVGVMAGWRLFSFDGAPWVFGLPVHQIALGLSMVAAALLFAPDSNRWLASRGRRDAGVIH